MRNTLSTAPRSFGSASATARKHPPPINTTRSVTMQRPPSKAMACPPPTRRSITWRDTRPRRVTGGAADLSGRCDTRCAFRRPAETKGAPSMARRWNSAPWQRGRPYHVGNSGRATPQRTYCSASRTRLRCHSRAAPDSPLGAVPPCLIERLGARSSYSDSVARAGSGAAANCRNQSPRNPPIQARLT